MKKQEHRWYWLWFVSAGMWVITFAVNYTQGAERSWLLALQLANIVLNLAAGVVNARRWRDQQRKRREKEEQPLF